MILPHTAHVSLMPAATPLLPVSPPPTAAALATAAAAVVQARQAARTNSMRSLFMSQNLQGTSYIRAKSQHKSSAASTVESPATHHSRRHSHSNDQATDRVMTCVTTASSQAPSSVPSPSQSPAPPVAAQPCIALVKLTLAFAPAIPSTSSAMPRRNSLSRSSSTDFTSSCSAMPTSPRLSDATATGNIQQKIKRLCHQLNLINWMQGNVSTRIQEDTGALLKALQERQLKNTSEQSGINSRIKTIQDHTKELQELLKFVIADGTRLKKEIIALGAKNSQNGSKK